MTQTATATAAPYLTKYSEDDWLDVFYLAVRNDNDRIAMLQKLANVKLLRDSDWDPAAVRYSFMHGSDGAFVRGMALNLTADQCFACLSGERWLYWHHIIQVQHGGSSSPRNLVRICHACHKRIHPWLAEPTSTENRRGWTSVRDMAVRVMDRLITKWEQGFQKPRPADDQPF